MKYLKQNKLYCFSPPVMLATFIIEIGLAMYTVWRYSLNSVTRLAALVLVALATFQLAEYNVCEGSWGISSIDWARVGYVAITLLPPLGIHLAARIAGDKRKWPVYAGYTAGALFVAYFLFAVNGIAADVCLGNYVIFRQGHNTGMLYGVYYYGLLLATIAYAAMLARKAKKPVKKSLYALVFGYFFFLVPTTVVNLIDPATILGIPSIMCGFAVALAFTLVFAVLPFIEKPKRKK